MELMLIDINRPLTKPLSDQTFPDRELVVVCECQHCCLVVVDVVYFAVVILISVDVVFELD